MAASDGGVSARHPARIALPLVVAASTGAERNTIRMRPLPIGCWRLEDVRFDFDSSLIRPDARGELAELAKLWHEAGEPPMSIFGHADPVGDDEYNKTLSGRRARAVYGLLTRDLDGWEQLYAQPFSSDDWHKTAVAMMVPAVGAADVRDFQTQNGLTPDGAAGPDTRRALFRAYMDAICRDPDDHPFQVQKTDFLGRGEDPGGKADFQGCSELNPILVFSRDEDQQFRDPSRRDERNQDNQPNRRVLVFLFPVGAHVPPAAWPCPRTSEPTAGCRAMLWPDAEVRRNPQDARREYERTHDTFACAFYDGMARTSPCETKRKALTIRLFGPNKDAIPNAPYRLTVLAVNDVREGTADGNGVLAEANLLVPSRVTIDYGDPRLGQDPVVRAYSISLMLDAGDGATDEQVARRRLNNLGYPATAFLSDALRAFQHDYGLAENGQLDDAATRDALEAAAERGKSRSDIAKGDLGDHGT
jgi:peptidoglycan hydrolase-like protein with peptidoglycan-binding domain